MSAIEKKFKSVNELQLGMRVTKEQLKEIYDTYMIIAYESINPKVGRLVYIGTEQNKEYDSWFEQTKPITPIYNSKDELEDMAVYDE